MNDIPQDNTTELLTAYLYNELDAGERAALETRLNGSPQLQHELQQLRSTGAAMDAWPDATTPSKLPTAVISAMASTDATTPMVSVVRSRITRATPWLGGLAAGLVLFVLLVSFVAEIRFADGVVAISFGQRGAVPASEDSDTQAVSQMLQRELDLGTAFTLDAVRGFLTERDTQQADRDTQLLALMQQWRREDALRFEQLIIGLAESAATSDQRLDARLNRVAQLVTLQSQTPFHTRFDEDYIP